MNTTLRQRQQLERDGKIASRANNPVAARRVSPARLVLWGMGVPYALAVVLISAFDPHLASPAIRAVGAVCVLAAAAYVHYLECFFRIARAAARDALATLLGIHVYESGPDATSSWDADAAPAQRWLVWLADALTICAGISGPLMASALLADLAAERLL